MMEDVEAADKMRPDFSDKTALMIVDVQKAIDHPSWGVRNNPEMETNLARLLAAWRERGWPVCHVQHVSAEPESTYRPGQEGVEFKDEVRPVAGERIVVKRVHSAFIGTDLEYALRLAGIHSLVVTGVITNNSVEATVRMGANLGFKMYVVSDGTATFGRLDWNGKAWAAGDVHALSLANLSGEYATVLDTAAALAAM